MRFKKVRICAKEATKGTLAQYGRPRHLVLCGSHAGVSIGDDGPTQMGLEDLAMFRELIDILYPADAVSAERLTTAAARIYGIVYIRTTRPKTPVIYPNTEEFPIGGSSRGRGDRAGPSPWHSRAAAFGGGI
jgi:transketolase C-terminal domain/subunit